MFLPDQNNPFRITYLSSHPLRLDDSQDGAHTNTPLIRTGPGGDYTRDHTGDDPDEGLTGSDILFLTIIFTLICTLAALLGSF